MTRPKFHFYGGYSTTYGIPPVAHNPNSFFKLVKSGDEGYIGRNGTASLEIGTGHT